MLSVAEDDGNVVCIQFGHGARGKVIMTEPNIMAIHPIVVEPFH